ncbi:MAG: tetratricopeptide repeat protein [Bdellovibrionales bacterium]|nr:tetratricopeptide repeat protein [Bdellovibrionales bacterium]
MRMLVCCILLVASTAGADISKPRLKAFFKSLTEDCDKNAPTEPPEFSRAEQVQLCVVGKLKKTLVENSKFLCPDADSVHCYTAMVDEASVDSPLPPQIQLVMLEAGVQVLTAHIDALRSKADPKKLEARGVLWLLEVLVSNGEAFVRSPACREGDTSLCPSRREGIAAIVTRGKSLFPPTADKARDALMLKDPHYDETQKRFHKLQGIHYYEEGVARFDAGDYSGAIKQYTEALKYSPKSFHVFYSRGSAKFELKNFRGALQDYQQGIRLNPTSARCYFFSAMANLKIGRTAQATKEFKKSQELSKNIYDQLAARYERDVASQ